MKMPAKNIYVRDEDVSLFERAEELGGESLSAVIAEALRRYVEVEEAKLSGYEEYTVEVGVWRTQGSDDTREIKFIGKMLAGGQTLNGQTDSRDDRGTDWYIYQTKGGKVIVVWEDWSRWEGENNTVDYAVLNALPDYDDLLTGDLLETERLVPGDILRDAANQLGQSLAKWIE
jgi:hypothetical protein